MATSQQNSVVKLAVLAQLLNETIDEVVGTQYHVREVKRDLTRLEDSIKKNFEPTINMLYEVDDMAMVGLGQVGDTIVNLIARQDIYTLADMITSYYKTDRVPICKPCRAAPSLIPISKFITA